MLSKNIVWFMATLFVLIGGQAEGSTTYTVMRYDTLGKIAKKECGNPAAYLMIAADNNVKDPNLIHVGQVLTINCNRQTQNGIKAAFGGPSITSEVRAFARSASGNTASMNIVPAVYRSVVTRPDRSAATKKRSQADPVVRQYIVNRVHEIWSPMDAYKMTAVIAGESGFKPDAVGYNCYYRISNGSLMAPQEVAQYTRKQLQRIAKSRSCKPQDIGMHWSVDCGVSQINHSGQSCPDRLMDIEYNLRVAKAKFDEAKLSPKGMNGFRPWVAYSGGSYQEHLGKYRSNGASEPVRSTDNVIVVAFTTLR